MNSIHPNILRMFIAVAIGLFLLTALLPQGERADAGASKAVFGVA